MADDEHRRRLLSRLAATVSRCHNPKNKVHASYGLRGITVYEEWRTDRAAFRRHAQTVPGWDQPELEMDRTDTNKGYEPGNIRFVTKAVNAANKRRINDLEQRIRDLEKEVCDLRSEQCRA